MGQKLRAVPLYLKKGELRPHLTQCPWAQAYLRTKWRLDLSSHLAAIDMGRKWGAVPIFWEGGGGSLVPI